MNDKKYKYETWLGGKKITVEGTLLPSGELYATHATKGGAVVPVLQDASVTFFEKVCNGKRKKH